VHDGFLLLQSMAGGTGAGVGSFLTEALADEYASAPLLNTCVWPFGSGEVAVQPYNTLLSLAALCEASSGLLLLQNEVLHSVCTRMLGVQQPGFAVRRMKGRMSNGREIWCHCYYLTGTHSSITFPCRLWSFPPCCHSMSSQCELALTGMLTGCVILSARLPLHPRTSTLLLHVRWQDCCCPARPGPQMVAAAALLQGVHMPAAPRRY
jgi:Tubulin/FtsZ family, GTPase domain